jgi:hypothetical protein
VQVRQTLQQVGAIGAYSAARAVTGAMRTESRRITESVYAAQRSGCPKARM